MGAVFLLGLLAGIDNLQVAAGIGAARIDLRRKWAFVGAFALFETLMPLLGLLVGQALAARAAPWAELAGPLLLAACGIAVLASAWQGGSRAETALANRWILLALPLALSFDNLLAGAGLGALGHPALLSSLIVGGCSGVMCLAGILLGDKIGALIPSRANLASGCWLVLLAGLTLLNP